MFPWNPRLRPHSHRHRLNVFGAFSPSILPMPNSKLETLQEHIPSPSEMIHGMSQS